MFENADGLSPTDLFMIGPSDDPDAAEKPLSPALRKALINKFGQEAFDAQYPVEAPDADAEPDTEATPPEGESVAPADTPSELLASHDPTEDAGPDADAQTDGFAIVDGDTPAQSSTHEQDPASAAINPFADELDLNDLFTRFNGGTKPAREQMVNLLNLVSQLGQLSPAQQAQMNAVLEGKSPASSTPVAAPAPTQTPDIPAPDLSNLAPEAAAILEPILARQAALEAQLHAQQVEREQANLAASNAQLTTGLAAGARQFVSAYQDVLSSTDMVLLETKVSQGGQFPYYLQQSNGDAATAYKSMLEAAIWQDEAMRERVISARQKSSTTQAAADATRKAKASSISGTSSVSSPLNAPASSTPATPLTRADMIKAAAAEVHQATGLSHPRPF